MERGELGLTRSISIFDNQKKYTAFCQVDLLGRGGKRGEVYKEKRTIKKKDSFKICPLLKEIQIIISRAREHKFYLISVIKMSSKMAAAAAKPTSSLSRYLSSASSSVGAKKQGETLCLKCR